MTIQKGNEIGVAVSEWLIGRANLRRVRSVGWSTGLEPATAGTTIQGSAIELRPPFPKGGLDYLNFGIRQEDFRFDHSPWGFPRCMLRYGLLHKSQR
jgi:hypothetical protein